MWLDAILAYLHYIAIFTLASFMVLEMAIIKGPLDAATVRRLGRVDVVYFGTAIVVLVTGFLRLVFGAKGPDFYLSAWPFYAKIGLFLAIAIISVIPTLAFIRWRRMFDHDPAWKVPPAEQARMKRLVLVELHLGALIPLVAVIMSRGLAR
jgi:putative membrane protein